MEKSGGIVVKISLQLLSKNLLRRDGIMNARLKYSKVNFKSGLIPNAVTLQYDLKLLYKKPSVLYM